MPTYDYRCGENGRVVEVSHAMSERIDTWGELCEQAGLEVGETSPQAKVERLANGGQIVRHSSLGDKATPCQTGAPCCGASACGVGKY
ncbi:MAG: zinc ribbon domain-containing protein [Oceanospirillaceae bacterium]|jgi:hypothetical protein|uniref:zinc ribbon domain-containing protein n=1 Tax=Marinobacterium litorale TaxID=404770 RepID=UPI000483717F|nr:zinc ribbon domain-containing protein [Marinobacterium litorale]MBS98968.1 zinc ribbon domain-containing protein [Oceanospirillaceae bacterium]